MANRNRLFLLGAALLLTAAVLGCSSATDSVQEAAEAAAQEEAVVVTPAPVTTATIGGESFELDSAELVLPAGTTEEELDQLDQFPKLTAVDGTACACYGALAEKAAAMPEVSFTWQGTVCGVTLGSGDETADLTASTAFSPDELLHALPSFPALKTVDLTGLTLTDENRDALLAAAPDTAFLWDVEVCGVTVAGTAAELDLSGRSVDMAELMKKLVYLPNLTKVDLCGCGFSDQEMEAFCAQCPGVKLVWMIQVGGWEMRTDVKAFSKGNRKTFDGGRFVGGKTDLNNEDIQPLRYCTDLVALDLGHSKKITDISIIKNMPKLRFLIMAMTGITDISPLSSCPELEYVETFQNYLEDLSPLLSLKKMTHLNCSTNIPADKSKREACAQANFELLKQMPQLQRLWCIRDGFSKSQIAELQALMPECEINTTGVHSTSNGWRDNDMYREMQQLFNLPALD